MGLPDGFTWMNFLIASSKVHDACEYPTRFPQMEGDVIGTIREIHTLLTLV
jgi:hypothetical protein